ncbi:MAG: class D sortase, partial [Oscillospiraceae bacterium]|nr:class D sortase [Oscillospiraceae bacterium]
MKRASKAFAAALVLGLTLVSPLRANAADYNFKGADATEYYPSTSYEDAYGAQYNYGGRNVSD